MGSLLPELLDIVQDYIPEQIQFPFIAYRYSSDQVFDKNKVCIHAASHGSLPLLQWARQDGCPWNEYTCSYAAKEVIWRYYNGHMKMGVHLTDTLVLEPLAVVIWRYYNGHAKTSVHGTDTLALQPL